MVVERTAHRVQDQNFPSFGIELIQVDAGTIREPGHCNLPGIRRYHRGVRFRQSFERSDSIGHVDFLAKLLHFIPIIRMDWPIAPDRIALRVQDESLLKHLAVLPLKMIRHYSPGLSNSTLVIHWCLVIYRDSCPAQQTIMDGSRLATPQTRDTTGPHYRYRCGGVISKLSRSPRSQILIFL